MTRVNLRAADARSPTGQAPASADAGRKGGAPLYTFDCRRANGSPICLELHELSSDERALAWAGKLLAEHLTCSRIEVFEGERLVGTVAREPSLGERSMAAEE